jgi:hypothetical protein
VVASTNGGSITLAGHLAGSCSVDTAGGSISIAVDDDTNIEVDASGSSASSDFRELAVSGGRLQGAIGTGGDGRLVARTVAGSVRIKRA